MSKCKPLPHGLLRAGRRALDLQLHEAQAQEAQARRGGAAGAAGHRAAAPPRRSRHHRSVTGTCDYAVAIKKLRTRLANIEVFRL